MLYLVLTRRKPTKGYVHQIDSRAIGYALIRIKAGRMQTSDTLDYSAGALLKPKIGDYVDSGSRIGTVLSNDEDKGKEVAELIRNAYSLIPEQIDKEKLIYDILR